MVYDSYFKNNEFVYGLKSVMKYMSVRTVRSYGGPRDMSVYNNISLYVRYVRTGVSGLCLYIKRDLCTYGTSVRGSQGYVCI